MASAFQLGAFQVNAFQIDDTDAVQPGVTILQRHKVDRLISGYSVSRSRYQKYKEQWAQDAINAQRELKRQKREQDAALGLWKIEDDKPLDRIWQGDALFHNFLRDFEQTQTEQARQKLHAAMADVAQRVHAAHQFSHQAAAFESRARALQLQRDLDEEGEALELMDMDD